MPRRASLFLQSLRAELLVLYAIRVLRAAPLRFNKYVQSVTVFYFVLILCMIDHRCDL